MYSPGQEIMQGLKRKVVYIGLYELIAVTITSGVFTLLGQDVSHASMVAVATSAIAIVWNLIWNSAFEWWEARQAKRGRGVLRRIAHAVGFELGLTVTIVPLFAWWLRISLWEALMLDVGLILFFLVYTFTFNLVFDRLFGLPASALPAPAAG